MEHTALLETIEQILKSKGLVTENVDLGISTVIGIDNIVCFEVTDGGFTALLNPNEVNDLQSRPEASILTDNFVPINDKLFINVTNETTQETILFWVDKTLNYFQNRDSASVSS